MDWTIPYYSVVLALYLLYRFALMIKGNQAYKEAELFEKNGKYREACYKYAEALKGTHKADCRKKIKHLWDTCETFGYLDIYDDCKERDSCGCGYPNALLEHMVTMSAMAEVIFGDK